MKTIIFFAGALLFVLALGTANAKEPDRGLYNGVTNFTGGSYDQPETIPAQPESISGMAAGENAGGFRSEQMASTEPYNGVTNFAGSSYDQPEIIVAQLEGTSGMAAGENAGGFRTGKLMDKPYNGVTNFSGAEYDNP